MDFPRLGVFRAVACARSFSRAAESLFISQPAVSQHLKVLRDNGFTTVRPDGQRRLYAVDPSALQDVDEWLNRFRKFWTPRLDALDTEIARGKRQRRLNGRVNEQGRQT